MSYLEIQGLIPSGTQSIDTSKFPSLLPTAMKIQSNTLGQQMSVFATPEEIDRVEARVKRENRTGKLDEVLNDVKYIETKLEDDEEYKKLKSKGVHEMSNPSSSLMYMDCIYGLASTIT